MSGTRLWVRDAFSLAALCISIGLVGGAFFAQRGAAASPEVVPGPANQVVEQNLDDDGYIRVHEQGEVAVNVTNASLSVGGALDARQSGDWSVGQRGSWTVEVSNLPAVQTVGGTVDVGNFPATQTVHVDNSSIPVSGTVQIGNTSANPVPVQQIGGSGRSPIALTLGSYNVPAGKRLVIESYSVEANGVAPSLFLPYVRATTGGVTIEHTLGVDRFDYTTSGGTHHYYTGSNQIRVYADPGSTVVLGRNCASACGASVTVSGYLEAAP